MLGRRHRCFKTVNANRPFYMHKHYLPYTTTSFMSEQVSKCLSMVGSMWLRFRVGYAPWTYLQMSSSNRRLTRLRLKKSCALPSLGDVFAKVLQRRRMSRTLHRIDWFLVASLEELAKPWSHSSQGQCKKHMAMYSSRCAVEGYLSGPMSLLWTWHYRSQTEVEGWPRRSYVDPLSEWSSTRHQDDLRGKWMLSPYALRMEPDILDVQ